MTRAKPIAATLLLSLALVSLALGVLRGAALAQPLAQTLAPAAGGAPSKAQTTPAQPQAAAVPSAQPAGTKRPPQATNPDEYAAYKALIAQANPVAAEQAAKDFDSKFPRSELRALLYYTLMHRYQEANNGAKAVEMGRKAVQLDPDNPVGLTELGNLLAEGTREGDLDREQRYAEATKNVQRGLQMMDSSLVVPPGTPPERVQQLKQFLTAMARATLGLVDFNHQNYAAAEPNLRQAAQLNTVQPDPMVYLRLAIALDHQNKYAEALQAANKVLELTPNGPLADLAHREKDRLQKLMGTSASSASTPATSTPATSTPAASTPAPVKPATTPPPAPATPPTPPPDKPKD
ncbi:MAG: tetratricopeptide repeat protein [Acidobacteriota bacterium]|nr:tetratricopeptide repeat protein [Acidobacteriota bacterium]